MSLPNKPHCLALTVMLEKLIEQETVVLETFHQNSRVQMIHFLDMIDDDAAKLRTELNF